MSETAVSRTKAKLDRRAARRNGAGSLDLLSDGELRTRLLAVRQRVCAEPTLRRLTRPEITFLHRVEDRGIIHADDRDKARQVLGFYEPTASEIISDIANGRRVPKGKHAAAEPITCDNCGTDIVAALQREQKKTKKTKATASLPALPSVRNRSIEQCFVGEQEIDVDRIEPDKDQPRKEFDAAELQALADDIQRNGLLQAIGLERWSMRPIAGTDPRQGGKGADYEATFVIVWGERRWRAVQLAGLRTVRARVYDGLTEGQRRDLQFAENEQRKDIGPIERAEAFARRNKPVAEGGEGLSLDEIAQRLGAVKGEPVSKGYVSGQIKLLQLIPEARKKLVAGELPVNTAIALARINDPESQARCWRDVVWPPYADRPASLRTTQDQIHRRFVRSLKSAPFDPADATLSPKAGACIGCPYRDAEANTCTKLSCFARKRQAAERQKIQKLKPAAVLKASEAMEVLRHNYYSSVKPQLRHDSKYVDLDAACPHGPKGKTWRRVLGEHAPAPIVAKHPADDKKRLFQLATKTDAYAALKRTGHKWAQKAKPAATRSQSSSGGGYNYAAQAKREREAHARRQQVVERAMSEIHSALITDGGLAEADEMELWRWLARCFAIERADCVAVAKLHKVSSLPKLIARASTLAELQAVAIELVALRTAKSHYSNSFGKPFRECANLVGVDLKKIEARVKAAEDTEDDE